MKTQPTPETSETWNAVSRTPNGMYDSSVPMEKYAYAMLDHSKKMERERDEAREQLAGIEDKMRVELGGHPNSKLWGDAGLIAATMRCVDALGAVTDQRDEAMASARSLRACAISRRGRADEVTEQRDRMAAVLQSIRDGYGGQIADPDCQCGDCEFLIAIDEALKSMT